MTPIHVEKGARPTITLPHVNGMPMEPGCYADGVYGWDHVRDVLAGMVEGMGHAGIGDELAALLQGPMSDDASEEDEALDLLNEHTTGGYWAFDENGEGLMLYQAEEE